MVMSVGVAAGRSRLVQFSCAYLATVLHSYDVIEWLIKAYQSCLMHGLNVISFARAP